VAGFLFCRLEVFLSSLFANGVDDRRGTSECDEWLRFALLKLAHDDVIDIAMPVGSGGVSRESLVAPFPASGIEHPRGPEQRSRSPPPSESSLSRAFRSSRAESRLSFAPSSHVAILSPFPIRRSIRLKLVRRAALWRRRLAPCTLRISLLRLSRQWPTAP
jgi:hypothetical protein